MQNRTQMNVIDYRDLFISHASEDKEDFVRPLANALIAEGLQVWFDESELHIGDSLRQKIDEGLRRSHFGLVVFSPTFFQKHWTQYEMDGLIARQTAGERVILPIWHRLTRGEIAQQSPSLTDIISLSSSSHSIEQIAREVAEVVGTRTTHLPVDQPPTAPHSNQSYNFAVFYIAPAGTSEPSPGPIPKQPFFAPSPTGWLSMVEGDEELEYIVDGNVLRLRLDWGNQWSGDEIQAWQLVSGDEPFALTMRPTTGTQRYFPSVRNTSQARWWQGHTNRSGWMVFDIH